MTSNYSPYLLCRTRRNKYAKHGIMYYEPYQWYILDVDKGEVRRASIPPMPIDACRGSTTEIVSTGGLSSNSVVMVIGGGCYCEKSHRCPVAGTPKNHQRTKLHYLDLEGPRVWKSGPLISQGRVRPQLINFGDGKVYLFGGLPTAPSSSNPLPPAEVLDIHNLENKEKEKEEWGWIPLTGPSDLRIKSESAPTCMSKTTVPDPKRRRVLTYFNPLKALYAFYPSDNSWVCTDPDFEFRNWCLLSTIVDDHDVLYCLRPTLTAAEINSMEDLNQFSSPHQLQAYDLLTHTWLNVTWSNPHKFGLRVMLYDSFFFHLGNSRLCILSPMKYDNHTNVLVMIIRVSKTLDGDIVAEKECTKSIQIDGFYNDFITLPQNAVKNCSLQAAAEEQPKADEKVMKLADAKQAVQLEIEQLRGELNVVKHVGDEGDLEELNKVELREKEEELEELESLNQTLIVHERMKNDELKDARKEMVNDRLNNDTSSSSGAIPSFTSKIPKESKSKLANIISEEFSSIKVGLDAIAVALLERGNSRNYDDRKLYDEVDKVSGLSDISKMKVYQALGYDLDGARGFLACPVERRELWLQVRFGHSLYED